MEGRSHRWRLRQRQWRALWRRLAGSLRRRGFGRTLRLGARMCALYWRDGRTPVGFDVERGVATAHVGLGRDLVEGPGGGLQHEATSEAAFAEMMARLPVSHADFTFIDVGSGLGRVLLMAAEFPFREVIGVEHARDLFEAAGRNLARARRRRQRRAPIRMVLANAANWEFPESPLVVFLYNPCLGEALQGIATALAASLAKRPRPLYVIYKNAREPRAWERTGAFACYCAAPGYIIYVGAVSRPASI